MWTMAQQGPCPLSANRILSYRSNLPLNVIRALEVHSQDNGMKTFIIWFLNQLMLQEALQRAGAAQYKRTDARKAHRNGYKDRSLKTRYGETTLGKRRFREFPFEIMVFGW